ncbi:MAG: helix-turn-helix transcriptional regulator [Lachnospiraceae bacterium]|nr:helix-turn-helix transcriptional regulator [Lachnospiraceae bacterium]
MKTEALSEQEERFRMRIESSSARESVPHIINTNLRMYIHKEKIDYPPHWHTDIEIIYLTAGTYKVTCGAHSYYLEEGDILLICPAVIHEIFATSDAGTRIYVQADFSKTISLKEIETAFLDMAPALHIRAAACPQDIYQELCGYIKDIQTIYFGSGQPDETNEGKNRHYVMPFTELDPYEEVEIYSILMRFIALAGKNLSLFQQVDQTNDVENHRNKISLSNACTYIAEHFTEEIALDDIASYAGFSKYHFSRIFTEYTGETFYHYLQQKRINFAQTLLSNPLLSITDIAYQSGFASSAAFTRVFRKSTGYTPSQFRLLNEERHPLSENEHFAKIMAEKENKGS